MRLTVRRRRCRHRPARDKRLIGVDGIAVTVPIPSQGRIV
jgi:hypothetical protein